MIQHKLSCSTSEYEVIKTRADNLEREAIHVSNKCEQYENLINTLNIEKKDMVEKSKYESL